MVMALGTDSREPERFEISDGLPADAMQLSVSVVPSPTEDASDLCLIDVDTGTR